MTRNKEKLVFNRMGYILIFMASVFGALTYPVICWLYSITPYDDPVAQTAEDISGHNLTELAFVGSKYFVGSL